jgi:hypothetical protein
MRKPIATSTLAIAALAAGVHALAWAQTPAPTPADKAAKAGQSWSVPRMPDGRPDMQGVWANNGMTPLERPAYWKGRTTMTDAELADLQQKAQKLLDGGDAFFADELILAVLEGKTSFSSADTQTGNYDQSWLSERVWDKRTSLIIDPPDGRIPPAAAGAAERARALAASRQGRGPADKAQDMTMGTRCITYGTPNIRAGYQSYFAITQGPDVFALRSEMIHDTRIFPIGAGPHVSPAIRQYHGDSRAHWEGDTLVVDTVHFSNANFRGSTDMLHLTEKFTRVSADTLEYALTIDDPTMWSRPWTLMIPLKQTDEKMVEFACHEGNYSLRAILSGARAQEQAAK